MATFSTNQVRQFYVAKELKSSIAEADKAGVITVKSDTAKNHLYFEYKGMGGVTRSDLIDIKNIIYAKATDADTMAHNLAKYKITLDSKINSGNIVAGQDYILKIAFRNYIGLSDEDQYFKFGMVHSVSGMTASDFYKEMVISLVSNLSKEEGGLLKFYLETGGSSADTVNGTPTEVTKYTDVSTLSGTYTGIVIEEAPQEWILGVFEQIPVNFTILPDVITFEGDERIWGVANRVASTSNIPNGKKIADLEYFCMGERGDQYRMIGFPNVIRTQYMVDSEVKYNIIDLHYSYIGNNEGVQKSEKTITLAIPKVGEENSTSNVLANSIIDAINTATGLTIPKLDVSGS